MKLRDRREGASCLNGLKRRCGPANAIEGLESRVLLSGYTLHSAGLFGVNASGTRPAAGVVTDERGDVFGIAQYGGAYDLGTVYEIPVGSPVPIPLASFTPAEGRYPVTNLVLDAHGNLYGMTSMGGTGNSGGIANNGGTVFELPRGSHTLVTLASINDGYGGGSIGVDSNGNVFGETYYPSAVFEVARGSGVSKVLFTEKAVAQKATADFSAGLVVDPAGNVYGATDFGGAYGDGSIFKLAAGSSAPCTLFSFDSTDGIAPVGLVLGSDGNLYGSTYGPGNGGTLFRIATDGSKFATLATLSEDGRQGGGPVVSVIDSAGNLYGVSYNGEDLDTLFELPRGASSVVTRAVFDGIVPGQNHRDLLAIDRLGNLYGTSQFGGAHGQGYVYELAGGSSTITTRASMNGDDGDQVNPGIVTDGRGDVFGTTRFGGAFNQGTVFMVPRGTDFIVTLASFNGTGTGALPTGQLAIDSSGNLFGTASRGGVAGVGTVFELHHGSFALSTVASFGGANGVQPRSGVVIDAKGDLLGTTQFGGTYDNGTVFEVRRGSSTITTLASFDHDDGAQPLGQLALDGSGNLYGTTVSGGNRGEGADQATVFKYSPSTSTLSALAMFSPTMNNRPATALPGIAVDANGNVFGTAWFAGSHSTGAIYEITAGKSTMTPLAYFDGTDGGAPNGQLLLDSHGNLFGTTEGGGASGQGVLFEIASGTATITPLASFDSTTGSSPLGVAADFHGTLVGITTAGTDSRIRSIFVATPIHYRSPSSDLSFREEDNIGRGGRVRHRTHPSVMPEGRVDDGLD